MSRSIFTSAVNFTQENVMTPNAKIPDGPLEDKWTQHRFDLKLVSPANKRKLDIIKGSPQLMHVILPSWTQNNK